MDTEVADIVLRKGADIDVKTMKGNTALQLAADKKHVKVVEVLIAKTPGINIKNEDNDTASNFANSEIEDSVSLIYKRTKGSAGMEGQLCEINLSMLLLLKCVTDERINSFHLASNMEKADKFDDIVLKYEYTERKIKKSKIIFLQAKHKNEQKSVNINSILSDSESGDLSLKKYFISYRKIKEEFSISTDPVFSSTFDDSEFIIYTNAPFSANDSCIIEQTIEDNDFLRISNLQRKYYQLDFSSNKKQKITNLLNDSTDSRRLAKELARSTSSSAGIDMQKEIFQIYHTALQGKVIEKVKDKLEGKVCDNFLNGGANLSSKDKEFRRIFLEEAGKIFKKEGNELKDELQNKLIKLSNKFGIDDGRQNLALPNDNVSEHEIKDFLKRFKLFPCQLSERDLEKCIKDKVKKLYSLEQDDVNLIFSDVQNKIQKWWKQGNKYLTKGDELFKCSKENLSTLNLVGLALLNTGRIGRLALGFKHDEIEKLSELILKKRILNVVANRGTILLSSIKVYQALETITEYKSENDDYKYIFMSLSSVLHLQHIVIDAFSNRKSNLLVIECDCEEKNVEDLYNKLSEAVRLNANKRIILITQEENNLNKKFKNCFSSAGEYGKVYEEKNRLTDLTIDSQKKLLKQQVIFQGIGVSLNTLVNDELKHLISAEVLSKLISNDIIHIDKAPYDVGEVKYYYIDRIFHRQIEIKRECFKEMDINDMLVVSNIKETELSVLTKGETVRNFKNNDRNTQKSTRFIILNDDENVQTNLQQIYNNYQDHNIHWLKKTEGKFFWQESQGVLSNFRRYVDTNNFVEHKTGQMASTTGRIVIVSAEPGMGKSTVLTKLAEKLKKSDPTLWVLRINFNDHTENLHKISPSKHQDRAIDLLCNMADLKTPLEEKLLKHRINYQGKIALFDGFDEISPTYKEKVLLLLKILKDKKVDKLWVTTRPHMKDGLEDELSTLSYTLKPFSRVDQKQFLERFWREKLDIGAKTDAKKFNTFSTKLLDVLSNSIADKEVEFTGIPLQIRMLAEAFQDNFKEYTVLDENEPNLPKILDLVDLYHRFIVKKYNIYSEEKKKQNPTNVAVEDDNTELRKNFIRNHQKAALYNLFEKCELKGLLSDCEFQEVNEFMTRVKDGREKTGIIFQVINDNLSFIHRTFAEYFAAHWLANNENNPSRKTFLLSNMYKRKNEVLRNFFDRILAYDEQVENKHEIHKAVLNKDERKVHALLAIDFTKDRDKGGRTALHLAAAYGYKKIVQDLLNYGADVSKIDKVFRWSPLRYADKGKYWDLAELLLKKGAKGYDMVDARSSIKSTLIEARYNTLLHIAAAENYVEFATVIIKENASIINAIDGQGKTPLHIATSHNNLNMVQFLVKNGAHVNAMDENKFTPLHWTGELDIYKYLVENGADVNYAPEEYERGIPLHNIVCHEKLDIVKYLVEEGNANVNAKDREGMTPLSVAAYSGTLDIVKYLVEERGANVKAKANDGSTPFRSSVFSGNLDVVKYLAEKGGADTNAKAKDGSTPLIISVLSGKSDIVKFLAENGADTNVKDKDGCLPLHRAAKSGKWDIVQILATKDTDFNARDHDGSLFLHRAASTGSTDVVKFLIDRGADVNAIDKDGRSPLHIASVSSNWDVVKFLIERGNDVNIRSEEGLGLLHRAAKRGEWDTVKFLIDKGADIEAKDNNGNTPLITAASNGKLNIVKLLVEKGADVNARNNGGKASQHSAAFSKNWDVVKFFVEQGVDANSKDQFGRSLLLMASASEEKDIVKYLVKKGADINAKTEYGITPLYVAAQKGNMSLVEYFAVEMGADINTKDNDGRMPLHRAAITGNWDIVELLVEMGADINTKDNDGWMPLHRAVLSGNWNEVEFLVEKGADVNARSKDGWLLLHKAASSEHWDIVKLLVKKDVDINAKDKNGRGLLHLMAKSGKIHKVNYLVDKNADVYAKDNDGWTPMHRAATSENWDIVNFFLEKGVDINTKDSNGLGLLHKAVGSGKLDIVKLLVHKGVDINATDNAGNTPLNTAANNGKLSVVKFLAEEGADFSVMDKNGRIPLLSAALRGNWDIVGLIVTEFVDVNAEDKDGWGLLHRAANSGKISNVKFLVERGAHVNATDKDGWTPLHRAASSRNRELTEDSCDDVATVYVDVSSGNWDVVKFLTKRGADVHARTTDGMTPLYVAALSGNLDIVKYLVEERGADINAKNKEGCTPVTNSASSGNWDALIFLIEIGADVNAMDEEGRMPLHWAAYCGKWDIVKFLAEKGSNVNAKDNSGTLPVHRAASSRKWDVVQILVEKGADVNTQDKNKKALLSMAVSYEKWNAIKFLVENDADVNTKDMDGSTPLHSAVARENWDTVKLLIEKSAQVNAKNNSGITPLHEAAFNGNYHLLKFLVGNSADVNAANLDGWTSLHMTVFNENCEAVKFLVESGAHVNIGDNNGTTPLHVACVKRNFNLIKFLFENGADLNAATKIGNTPLTITASYERWDIAGFLAENGAIVKD